MPVVEHNEHPEELLKSLTETPAHLSIARDRREGERGKSDRISIGMHSLGETK